MNPAQSLPSNEAIWQRLLLSFKPSCEGMPARREELDWLRVLAFGLLIFYHIGMVYVANWGYHFKSMHTSETLESFMLLVSPWRMAILWVISGIAIRFLLVKVSLPSFLFKRTISLLLPLLFGVLVVVPPQLYVEMTQNAGLNISFSAFMVEFYAPSSTLFENYQAGIWPHIDVNHLWYLRSLWQYSLLLVILLPLLNAEWLTRLVNTVYRLPAMIAITLATLPILILELTWQASEVRYPIGFTFLLYGFFIGWSPLFWQRLRAGVKPLAVSAVLVLVSVSVFYQRYWLPFGDELAPHLQLVGVIIYSLAKVLGMLAVLALGSRFLSSDTPRASTKKASSLSYWSNGVYCFYILHQTLIVVVAYQLSLLELPAWVEAPVLIALTIGGCLLGYEMARRSVILRPLLGIKAAATHTKKEKRLGYVIAAIVVSPLVWALIF